LREHDTHPYGPDDPNKPASFHAPYTTYIDIVLAVPREQVGCLLGIASLKTQAAGAWARAQGWRENLKNRAFAAIRRRARNSLCQFSKKA